MDDQKQIIEINGIKLEVDMRHAKRIDQFRVGDNVKVLIKEGYSNKEHVVYPGVIVGFEPFEKLPTIIVAYIKTSYEPELNFAYINPQDKEVEIVKSQDDYVPVEKNWVIDKFDSKIEKLKREIEEIERKKTYFLKHFNQYFKQEA